MILVASSVIVLVVLTTVLHYEVLRGLTASLPRLHVPPRTRLMVIIFAAFLAHSVEIALYGLALFALVGVFGAGSLTGAGGFSLLNCIYFSAETYTSLGFGDIVPVGPVRMMAGAETLNGLLLIGWSASYTYIAMERFWNEGGNG